MPFRCMQYDAMEYGRQIAVLQKENDKANDYETGDEWDGPRSLKDMMDFGEDSDGMSRFFADYPFHLYCINEQNEFDLFHTEIKELFQLMKYRKDKKRLQQELNGNPKYHKMDMDTLEVLSVVLSAPRIWKERKKYTIGTEEKEECDMCRALQEWIADERNEGIQEGIQVKKNQLTKQAILHILFNR